MRTNAARRPIESPQSSDAAMPRERVDRFLSDLTELSSRHGIAITGSPILFVMEKEDFATTYRIDDDSNLIFG